MAPFGGPEKYIPGMYWESQKYGVSWDARTGEYREGRQRDWRTADFKAARKRRIEIAERQARGAARAKAGLPRKKNRRYEREYNKKANNMPPRDQQRRTEDGDEEEEDGGCNFAPFYTPAVNGAQRSKNVKRKPRRKPAPIFQGTPKPAGVCVRRDAPPSLPSLLPSRLSSEKAWTLNTQTLAGLFQGKQRNFS